MNTVKPRASRPRRIAVLSFIAALAIVALFAPARSGAQELGGTYYYVAFPDTTANALDSRYPNTRVRSEASLWIYSAVKNKVRITSNGGASTTLTLEAGKFKIYQIPGSIVVDVIGSPVSKSLRVESDYPIMLYCYFANIQGLEAWTPIPVVQWGTQYYAAARPGEVVKEIGVAGETEVPETPKPGPAEILVVAAYDNTTVTLTPPAGTEFAGKTPTTVTLNEGQVYQVQSSVKATDDADRQQDIGGTRIVADKPIGVISGNTRSQIDYSEVGLKNNVYKNLMIEWLRPTEQYGREFVYMPTWDSHRPGIGATAERRYEYVRVYNGSGKTLNGSYTLGDTSNGGTRTVPFTVRADTLTEIAFAPIQARVFRTDAPAQVMMQSSAIVQYNGSTPCFRGIPCLSYSAWAPYMVEMVPREQWGSFAPYYAPPNPGGMQHYINVVTDTNSALKIVRENGSTFLFNRRIPGTDLIWGSMSVSQGEDHTLTGSNGAKFSGFVYGLYQGGEEYRPGRTRKRDDDPSVASGGGASDPSALHPCEYEEYNAVSYGYPLISVNTVLKPADSLKIDTTTDCWMLRIKITALNANPTGLAYVQLDPTSVKNAKLVPVNPQRLSDIIGRAQVEVVVEPIDPTKNADATVIIKDRTGKVWRVDYHYEAEYATTNPTPEVNYGRVMVGDSAVRTVTITNPLAHPLVVKEIRLALGNQGYTIVSTAPDGPARPTPQAITLAAGGTMTVDVRIAPTVTNPDYIDTLKVILGCTVVRLPLVTRSATPRIYVGDLEFGSFIFGVNLAKTLGLQVCNIGTGELRFSKPGDPDPTHLLEWLQSSDFTVNPSEIAKLKDTVLEQNECFTIHVTFTPSNRGWHRVVARFWGSTRDERDTSVWTATVVDSAASVNDAAMAGYAMTASSTGSLATVRYTLARAGGVRLEIYNSAGERVERIVDRSEEGGDHQAVWDASGRPAGLYVCVIESGGWRRAVPIVIVR